VIVAFFVYGFGVLNVRGAPPYRGYNRLAWALPFGVGLAGAGPLA
jgi:hypothetical protein